MKLNQTKMNDKIKTEDKTVYMFDQPAKKDSAGKTWQNARKAKQGMLFMVGRHENKRWGIYQGYELKENDYAIYQIAILKECEAPEINHADDNYDEYRYLEKADRAYDADRCRFIGDTKDE